MKPIKEMTGEELVNSFASFATLILHDAKGLDYYRDFKDAKEEILLRMKGEHNA